MKTETEKKELKQAGMVELVAGPLCGMCVKWPFPERTSVVKYHAGRALYRLEEQPGQTALYVQDV